MTWTIIFRHALTTTKFQRRSIAKLDFILGPWLLCSTSITHTSYPVDRSVPSLFKSINFSHWFLLVSRILFLCHSGCMLCWSPLFFATHNTIYYRTVRYLYITVYVTWTHIIFWLLLLVLIVVYWKFILWTNLWRAFSVPFP